MLYRGGTALVMVWYGCGHPPSPHILHFGIILCEEKKSTCSSCPPYSLGIKGVAKREGVIYYVIKNTILYFTYLLLGSKPYYRYTNTRSLLQLYFFFHFFSLYQDWNIMHCTDSGENTNSSLHIIPSSWARDSFSRFALLLNTSSTERRSWMYYVHTLMHVIRLRTYSSHL